MMIENFIEELVNLIQASGNGLEAIPTETQKNNGVVRHGLTLRKDDSRIAPILYVDEWYKQFQSGDLSVQDVSEHLMREYEKLPIPDVPDLDSWLSAPDLINKVNLRLVNRDENSVMIQERDLVYHEVENTDLVCLFYVELISEEGSAGEIAISKRLLEQYLPEIANGEELYKEVASRIQPERILLESIVDVIERLIVSKTTEIKDLSIDKDLMYVLTNKRMSYGASAILTDACRKIILEKFPDGKVTLLPSSVHETLLLCTKVNEDLKNLRNMVWEVNQTEISREEFLSNNVYHYDANTGKLEIAYLGKGDIEE